MVTAEHHHLAVWMRPALTRLNAAEFERCAAWVAVLDQSGTALEDLTLAAHNHLGPAVMSGLESTLSGADVGYTPGDKKALLSRLAAAVLMGKMSRSDGEASKAGLLIRSAAFVGLKATIGELPGEACACLTRAGVEIRQRPSPARATPKRRKKTEVADDDFVTMAMLRTELALRDTALSALSKRVDELVTLQWKQTSMVDEEVDALWWARSGSSWTTGEAWADIEPLDRGVLAGLEVSSLLRWAPIAPEHARLVATVTAGPETQFSAVEIATAVDRHCNVVPELIGHPAVLRPLASASAACHESRGDEGKLQAALRNNLGLGEAWRKSAFEVAEQLLVEKCLEMIA